MADGHGTDDATTLRRLIDITASLNSTLNLDELLTLIIDSTAELLGAETASLLLVDEETGELIVRVATGDPGEEAMRQRVPAGQGIAGWVVEHDETLIVSDPKSDERFYEGMDQAIGFETRNLVAVPLRVRGRVIGAVEAINKRDGSFDDRDAKLASALSNQAAIAIDNSRLYAKLADAVVASRMSYRL